MPPLRRAPLVYLITDGRASPGDALLREALQAALRALARSRIPPARVAVQLREKQLGAAALLELARQLRAATSEAGLTLFVNERVDVALAAGADGVHLGAGALSVADVRAIAPGLQVALSTHSPGEVARAAADSRVSFVVFGPVFDTPSKRHLGRPQGLGRLRDVCASPIPVVALGGVHADNISDCFSAGASGVASIGQGLGNPSPEASLSAFFGAIERT